MYRTICTELWTDPKVRQLSCQGRLLFVYLITNPHTHLCGLYYLLKSVMQEETALNRRGFDGAWKGLMNLSMIEYDESRKQVWVKKMFGFQGKGQKTERGVASHLAGLHPSPLIERFLLRYPQVMTYLPADFERYPIEGASEGDAVLPSPSPVPIPLPQKRGKGRNNATAPFPQDDRLFDEEFKTLCAGYGLVPGLEYAHFKGKAAELGWTSGNWKLKARNWILQEVKFRQPRRPP